MEPSEASERSLYRYRFEDADFDAARAQLRVAGERVELEQRPLQVLALLLEHVDEVVPRAEMFDTVWEGRPTVDNVLANAVAKLRKGLGDHAAARIVTVPRVGYRLLGPVERMVAGRRAEADFELKAGQPMPGREHFHLLECLDPAGHGVVWRVRHNRTDQTRVYKFAFSDEQLAALKREVTIDRLLREKLGEREDQVPLIDWNFDTAPYWVQRADAGCDFTHWSNVEPAFAAASTDQRIAWFLQVADAVAAAHSVGVLHKDLKPSNILVASRGEDWQLRVTDFGSGRLLQPEQLDALGITRMGLTVTSAISDDSGVTLLYLAPEVLAGEAPSVQSDVYALGLILLQMVVGDLHRTLAPGWQEGINDELLVEDIAAATHGDPVHRLHRVEDLTQRLRSRELRAIERQRLRDADARAQAAERKLEHSRTRRPWLITAIVLLTAGLAISLWQITRVRAARAQAQQQARLAEAANQFLNDDLLGGGMRSPAWNERNPTLSEIIDAAAPRLNKRFAGEPLVLATLRGTLGRAYKTTGELKKSAAQLQAAAKNWKRAAGPTDARTVRAQYELVSVLANIPRFDAAAAVLKQADAAAGSRRLGVSEIALRAHLARGDVAYHHMHFKQALAEYQAAQVLQRTLHPDDALVSAHILLTIAGCQLRLQQARQAEATARKVLAGSPYTQQSIGLGGLAQAHHRLAEALRAQGRFKEAIAEGHKALAGMEKAQGANSQSALGILGSLSYLYSLAGNEAKALAMQREAYERGLKHWGPNNQGTLISLLNLGYDEADIGQSQLALKHLRKAAAGLARVSGANAAVTQAARVGVASTLSDLGHNKEALAMISKVDPQAYQATSSDPGQAEVLAADKARIELRLHQPGAAKRLRAAMVAMKAAGVSDVVIAEYRKTLVAEGH